MALFGTQSIIVKKPQPIILDHPYGFSKKNASILSNFLSTTKYNKWLNIKKHYFLLLDSFFNKLKEKKKKALSRIWKSFFLVLNLSRKKSSLRKQTKLKC